MRCFRDSECEAYLSNLDRLTAGRCDCILASPALFVGAFSVIPPCEFSPCKSPTIGPLWWYKGLWIKQGACGSASQKRGEEEEGEGGENGVTLTSTADNFNFKHVPLFAVVIVSVTVAALCSVPSSCGNPLCVQTSLYSNPTPPTQKRKTLSPPQLENSSSSSLCFCTSFSLESCPVFE